MKMVYMVYQKFEDADVIVGVFSSEVEASKCAAGAAHVTRYVDSCEVRDSYDPADDWDTEETV